MCIIIVCAFGICVCVGVSGSVVWGMSCLIYVDMPGMCVGGWW